MTYSVDREKETAVFWRVCKLLSIAEREGDAREAALLRQDLGGIAMNTDQPSIRARCQKRIEASLAKINPIRAQG